MPNSECTNKKCSGCNEFPDILFKLSHLITMSELRIDRTNDMICKAFSLVDKITLEYTKQIDKLQLSRDEAVKQNSELIKLSKKYEAQVDACNKRYDLLLERLLSLASSNNKSENNIHVK